jgi:hypothetical protein
MGGGCQPDGSSDSLKSAARQNNTWFINTRPMSSELRRQERAVSELMPEVSVLDRFLVRRGDQIRTGDCLEQQQVRGAVYAAPPQTAASQPIVRGSWLLTARYIAHRGKSRLAKAFYQ